jgi:hypothetical protein
MRWICKLSDEHGRRLNDQHARGTNDQPRNNELCKRSGCRLNDCGNDNANDAAAQYFLPSNAITEPSNQRKYQNASDILRGIHGA